MERAAGIGWKEQPVTKDPMTTCEPGESSEAVVVAINTCVEYAITPLERMMADHRWHPAYRMIVWSALIERAQRLRDAAQKELPR